MNFFLFVLGVGVILAVSFIAPELQAEHFCSVGEKETLFTGTYVCDSRVYSCTALGCEWSGIIVNIVGGN